MQDSATTVCFVDLPAYRLGRELQSKIYAILCRIPLPRRLEFGEEMWAEATAVTSNIAEGWLSLGNGQIQMALNKSQSSVRHVRSSLYVLREHGYLEPEEEEDLRRLTDRLIEAIEDTLNGH